MIKHYIIHKRNRKEYINVKSANQIKVVDDVDRPDAGQPAEGSSETD